MTIFGLFILILFLAEVVVLTLVERKLWHTWLTPLTILSIPYTVVMLISIGIAIWRPSMDFYAPSLLIWGEALAVFGVVSWLFAFLVRRISVNTQRKESLAPIRIVHRGENNAWLVFGITTALCLIYAVHAILCFVTNDYPFGSDEFGSAMTAGHFWGHLFVVLLAAEIICFYYLSLKRWYMIIPILFCILFEVIYQVKSWMLTPILAVILMKIHTGAWRINLKAILLVGVVGVVFFFGSYTLSSLLAHDRFADMALLTDIWHHFLYYLSSGVLGFSEDLRRGIYEMQDPCYPILPFINLWQAILGGEIMSPVNMIELNTGFGGAYSNVRTFVGTLYVFSRGWTLLYMFAWGVVFYTLHTLTVVRRSLTWLLPYSWMCSIILFAWFDYILELSNPYEVAFILWISGLILTRLRVGNVSV